MTYSGLISGVIDFINILIPGLFAVVFVFFVWKMIDAWILRAGDPAARADGNKFAVAAVLMFVLMVSAWGIVTMIKTSLL